MSVRAKFGVWNVQQNLDNTGKVSSVTVKLGAVAGSSEGDKEENKKFWQATPSADLTMVINNPAAYDQFLPGMQFYVDFTEVPLAIPA